MRRKELSHFAKRGGQLHQFACDGRRSGHRRNRHQWIRCFCFADDWDACGKSHIVIGLGQLGADRQHHIRFGHQRAGGDQGLGRADQQRVRLTQTKRMSCFLSGLTSPNKYAVVKSRAKNKISSKTTKNMPSNLSDSIINIHNNDHNSANSGRLSSLQLILLKMLCRSSIETPPEY